MRKKRRNIQVRLTEFRRDYEVVDVGGTCRGHIWKHAGSWVIRVNGCDAQYRQTFQEAVNLAQQIIG